jgi:ATP-dependent DNA ligase
LLIEFLEEIKNTSSTKEKVRLLGILFEEKEYKKLFKYAYDPFYIYGIKNLKVKKIGKKEITSADLRVFFLLLDKQLRNPTNTITSIKQFEQFLSNFDKITQEYLIRVINKDLEIGINVKSIAKCDPDLITIFELQLAHPLRKDKLEFPVAVEPKFDGVRAVYLQGKLYTRNLHEIKGYDHIKKELLKLPQEFCYDGELLDKDFQSTMSKTFSKEINQDLETKFYIFDLFDAEYFASKQTFWEVSFARRRRKLEKLIRDFGYLILVENKIVENIEEMENYYQENIAKGLEGIMIKSLEANYHFSRNFAMMKLKPVTTMDMRVLEVKEGSGKLKGKAGSVLAESLDGVCKAFISTNSDEYSNYFWNNKNKNLTIEVLYDSITEDKSLRFPRIKCIRRDL